MTTLTNLANLYVRGRYLVLLGTLLVLLVVQPIVFGFSTTAKWFDAFLSLVAVALLLSLCEDRSKRLFALLVGVPTALLSSGGYLLEANARDTVVLIGHGIGITFFFSAVVLIIASIFRSQRLTLDSISGAICGYLLLGVAWGVLYSMLDVSRPGSFEISERLMEQLRQGSSRGHLFTYYSFVTLTTVGYGDVTPISTPARTCAWIEALTGQFYIAVLVAGLIGALISKKPKEFETE